MINPYSMGQNKKKKIVWLYSHFLFRTGGTRFILEVTKRLHKSWDVKIVVERASPEIINECKQHRTKITEIGSLTSTSPIYWLLFPLMLKIYEKRIRMETEDADVVISGIFPMNFIYLFINKTTIVDGGGVWGQRPHTTFWPPTKLVDKGIGIMGLRVRVWVN